MDPATAIAVTGIVIQLIGSAIDLGLYCREVFLEGSTESQRLIAKNSDTLITSCNNLEKCRRDHPTDSEDGLLDIARSCLQTGKELNEEVQHIIRSSSGGSIAIAKHAIYSVGRARRVKRLRLQLSEYQRLLDTKYLESLHKKARDPLRNQQEFFKAQDPQMQYMIARLTSRFTETDALFLSDARKTRVLVKKEHETTRESVSGAVEAVISSLRAEHQCDNICSTLGFHNMTYRKAAIENPENGTFEDSVVNKRGTNNRPSFADWLKSTDRIYWIEGKPGSGKSTMMKFLADHECVQSAFRVIESMEPSGVVILKYFAWFAGDNLQRSVHGMLRALLQFFAYDRELLLDLIRSENRSFPKVFGDKKILLGPLQRAICKCTHHVIAFIDGLDEFEKESGSLTEWLALLQALDLNICFASRLDTSFRGPFPPIPSTPASGPHQAFAR